MTMNSGSTAMALSASQRAESVHSWRSGVVDFRGREPRLFGLAVMLVAAMTPTLFAMVVDARTFLGVNVWEKPLKFEVALSIYALSLVFFARWLDAGTRQRVWYRIYIGAVIAAILAEMIWIGSAAALDAASHFNMTALGAGIYGVMGILAVLLTSASFVYAVSIARNAHTGLSPVVKEAVVTGLALVLPLTLVTAGTMSSMGGHFVGGSASDAGGLPLFGWARDGGDLRVAHFFATHAMHAVPIFGLISAALLGGQVRWPLRIFAVGYVSLVAVLFVQALAGYSVLTLFSK